MSNTFKDFFIEDRTVAPFLCDQFYSEIDAVSSMSRWQISRYLSFGNEEHSSHWRCSFTVSRVAFAYPEEIQVLRLIDTMLDDRPFATFLQNISESENVYSGEIMFISPELIENPAIKKVIEKMCPADNITFDTRNVSSPVHMSTKTHKILYNGPVSKRMENTYVKTSVAYAVKRMMCTPLFIEPPYRIHGSLTNEVIEKLIDAVTFGDAKVSMPTGSNTGRKLTGHNAQIFANVVFDGANGKVAENETLFETQKFTDYTALWLEVLRQQKYYALTVAPNDLLVDFDNVKAALSTLSSIMGMDSFIEAYKAGVPVSDIIN